jgi:hypothetical protein
MKLPGLVDSNCHCVYKLLSCTAYMKSMSCHSVQAVCWAIACMHHHSVLPCCKHCCDNIYPDKEQPTSTGAKPYYANKSAPANYTGYCTNKQTSQPVLQLAHSCHYTRQTTLLPPRACQSRTHNLLLPIPLPSRTPSDVPSQNTLNSSPCNLAATGSTGRMDSTSSIGS